MNKEQREQYRKDLEEYGAYNERLRMITWLKSFQNLDIKVILTRGDETKERDIFADMIATLEKQPLPKLITQFEELRKVFPGTDDEMAKWLQSLPEVAE
jgi:hypothetical protein